MLAPRFQPMSDFYSYLLTEEDFIQPGNLFSESEPGVSKDWRRRTTQTIGPHLDLAPQVNRLNHVGVSRSPVTSQTGLVRAPSGRSSHRTYLPDRRSIMHSHDSSFGFFYSSPRNDAHGSIERHAVLWVPGLRHLHEKILKLFHDFEITDFGQDFPRFAPFKPVVSPTIPVKSKRGWQVLDSW